MTQAHFTANNSASGQLFDLKQRDDGAWIVWTRKSQAELGFVVRSEIESARQEPFTDSEWSEFVQQPHFTEQNISVIAGVYPAKPTTEAVLNLLGIKRKVRNTDRKPRLTPVNVPELGIVALAA